MKKIRISVILLACLAMLLTLAACGEKEPDASQPQSGNQASDQQTTDPTSGQQGTQAGSLYDTLSSLIENGAVKSGNLSVSVTGAVKSDGVEMPLTLGLVMNTESETESLMKFSLNLLGKNIEKQTYRHGDEVYTNANGIKTKQAVEDAGEDDGGLLPIDVDEMKEKLEGLAKDNKLVESLKQVQPTVGTDGSVTYAGTLLAADLKETIDKASEEEELTEQLPDTVSGLTQMFDPSQMTINDVPYKVVFDKEGRIVSADGNVTMSMDQNGQTMEISLTLELKASYPGKVEAPTDLDEYKDPITLDNYQDIYELLFDEDGNLIENNETAYNLLCAKYGKAAIDDFISTYTDDGDWDDSDWDF